MLERYLRNQIYRTSKKRLQNPVFWLELSISTLSTEADWRAVVAHAKGIKGINPRGGEDDNRGGSHSPLLL